MNERRVIEFVIRYVWNIVRVFVRGSLTPRCSTCGISGKAAPLGGEGRCEACLHPERNAKEADRKLSQAEEDALQTELRDTFASAAGRGAWKYDALVFFSGGKDSTYLLDRIRREHPLLRILAVSVDNSFMSPVGLANIDETARKIDVDHVVVRPDKQLYEKLFRYAFTHPRDGGAAVAIDVLDGELRFDIGRHMAARFGIPLMVIGFSRSQVATYGGAVTCIGSRAFEESKRSTLGPYTLDELPLSGDERGLLWDGTAYPKDAIATIVYPLAAWNVPEETIKKEVVERGLIPAGRESPLATNHLLIPLMALVDMATLGYSSWETEFARMIREGKADLRYWRNLFELLEYAAKTGRLLGRTRDALLKRLSLTPEDVGLAR
ncbi:MAG TPA: hypothetical protein VLB83_00480 [Candidatus Paceibacterota bacterium]|nr:hypothetical protein [Candidatus Paceibacterota bacterium]